MWKYIMLALSIGSLTGMFLFHGEESQAMEILEIRSDVSVQAANMKGIKQENWSLQYKLKNQDLYVECIIPDFSLTKEMKENGGYLLIKMNGQKTAEMHQAAFMLKNMPPGEHTMEIIPVEHNGKQFAEPISFEIKVNQS
ncbi:hypothetical protein [Alteribacillus iranensis]|uniref:Uncharacterized protein n=1 Tax=Alteribacillus iranensis TaxID=930128 RepID=A0A1I2AE05_9BACI|nr:hypothetical protein [Alteribacillus iranensis]SFE41957.1 hypothetical protein SAMN05192532_101801 [Alteribacillus iranensis]